MTKVINRITAVVSIAVIGALSLLTVLILEGSYSESENRQLHGLPELSLSALADGSYFSELSSCFTDHFAFRRSFVSSDAGLSSGVCERIVNGVYIGNKRLLDAEISLRGSSEANDEIINRFADNYDGAVYIAAIPTSSGVYSSMLPEYLSYNGEKQQIDRFYAALNSSVRKIDAYSILKMQTDDYIFYRSDTKWTGYGAYCVYKTVIQKLGFMPTSYGKYDVRHIADDYCGDLYGRTQYMKSKKDILDIYEYSDGAEVESCKGYDCEGNSTPVELYDLSALESVDKYDIYTCGKYPLMRIHTSVNNERKLLVIMDDMGRNFVPFLLQQYSEVAVVCPKLINGSMYELIDADDYEQTLILIGADSLDDDELLSPLEKMEE